MLGDRWLRGDRKTAPPNTDSTVVCFRERVAKVLYVTRKI